MTEPRPQPTVSERSAPPEVTIRVPCDTCVIVSFYDERPIDELVRLLRQLRSVNAGADFELCVVINSDSGRSPQIPTDLASTRMIVRENIGFNIGAWDFGWRQNPGFSFYIFLQDECEIVRSNWLSRYKLLLSSNGVGLVGESLLHWKDWKSFKAKSAEIYDACVSLAERRGIRLGRTPTHIQTLALGATASCLEKTDGFLVADGKAKAIATEVLLSRNCIHRGFKISQSAWRPFEYIRHSQWDFLRGDSTSILWNVSRALKHIKPH